MPRGTQNPPKERFSWFFLLAPLSLAVTIGINSCPKRNKTVTTLAKKKMSRAPADRAKTDEVRRAARRKREQEAHTWYYDDLVKLSGKTRNTIYRHVARHTLDPANIESVLYWLARHGTSRVKRNLLDYALEAGSAKNPAE